MPAAPARVTNDAPILDISLDVSGREPVVSSKVEWSEHIVDVRHDDPAQFGMPTTDRIPAELSLPPGYADAVAAALPAAPSDIVWLRLNRPTGYLSGIPWETIAPAGKKLVRLPNEMAIPHNVSSYRRLAVLAGTTADDRPDVQRHLAEFVGQLRRRIPLLEVHLFGDPGICESMRAAWRDEPGVAIHDPRDADPTDRTASPLAATWITRELKGTAVQALHVVLPGAFDVSDPVLVVRELDRRQPIAFADADDVKSLADAVGAPLVSLASPAAGQSDIAVRMVADTVGATRPGPTVYVALDPMSSIARALAGTHDDIGNRRGSPADGLAGDASMFCYLQPEVLEETPRLVPTTRLRGIRMDGLRGGTSPWIGQLGTRAFEIDGAPRGAPMPLWAASSSRFVESRRAELARLSSGGGVGESADSDYLRGAAAALEEIDDLIEAESGEQP